MSAAVATAANSPIVLPGRLEAWYAGLAVIGYGLMFLAATLTPLATAPVVQFAFAVAIVAGGSAALIGGIAVARVTWRFTNRRAVAALAASEEPLEVRWVDGLLWFSGVHRHFLQSWTQPPVLWLDSSLKTGMPTLAAYQNWHAKVSMKIIRRPSTARRVILLGTFEIGSLCGIAYCWFVLASLRA